MTKGRWTGVSVFLAVQLLLACCLSCRLLFSLGPLSEWNDILFLFKEA